MKQKKSLAWKERQGLQRKEQATKQKKCVGWQSGNWQGIFWANSTQVVTPAVCVFVLAQAGRQPESADRHQAAEQEGQAREEAYAGRV